MRYIQSQHSFRQFQQPKKSWWKRIFSRKNKNNFQPRSRYTNPYLRTKKPKKTLPLKTAGVLILVFSWLALMVYLPYFRINKTEINGLNIIKQEEIQMVIDQYLKPHRWWPDNNYFLVRGEGMQKKIMEKFSLSGVQIQKVFPDKIIINVEEKISSIIYDNGTDYYLLDQNGFVLKNLLGTGESATTTTTTVSLVSTSTPIISTTTPEFPTSTEHKPDFQLLRKEYGDLPVVFDLREPIIDRQNSILSKNYISGIIELYSAIKKVKIGSVQYFTITDPNAGVELILDKPWNIRLQPLNNVTEQTENIQMILKQYKPGQYIDVRFGTRVYWK